MCTLCLSDMGELNDVWMRAPRTLMDPYILAPIDRAEGVAIGTATLTIGQSGKPSAAPATQEVVSA